MPSAMEDPHVLLARTASIGIMLATKISIASMSKMHCADPTIRAE